MRLGIWSLRSLREHCSTVSQLNCGIWMPVQPDNTKKQYLTLRQRIGRAWAAFTCQADLFYWPENVPAPTAAKKRKG